MKNTVINEPSGFDYNNSYISCSEKAGGDLVWHTEKTVLKASDSRNGTGKDIYIKSAETVFRSFTLKSVSAVGRKFLDSDLKTVRVTPQHTLYKSEQPEFLKKLFNESGELFYISVHKKDSRFTIKISIYFESDFSIYDAEFSCSDIITSWDELSEPVMKSKLTLKERADRLKLDIPAVFLALNHNDTPRLAKMMSAIAIGYALSPLDLIPDFIPVLGYLDDVLILPGLLFMAIRLIPEEVMEECRIKSKDMWEKSLPVKWIYAVPVILIWIIILALIINAFI